MEDMKVAAIRVLAVLCLTVSGPIAAVKLPWMPATIIETIQSYEPEPYPNGTADYLEDRRRLFVEHHIASGMYLLGIAAAVVLFAIAGQRLPRSVQPVGWLLVVIAGAAITWYELRELVPHSDFPVQLLFFAGSPAIATGLAVVAFVLSVLPSRTQ
jgi:hypothetical protein